MQHLLTDNPLWLFSTQQYQKPLCQQALLALQDEYGLNVNMLLFMHYANAKRVPLSADGVQQYQTENTPLTEAIQHLRQQRRVLKNAQPELYEVAKAQELALEQLHIACLWQAFTQQRAADAVLEDNGDIDNIASYLSLFVLDNKVGSELEALLQQLQNSINNAG